GAKKPAARMSVQKTILPASGWILSAREIKLVTPVTINETTQTVTRTTSAIIIFRALKFCSVDAAFMFVFSNSAPLSSLVTRHGSLFLLSLVSTGLGRVQLLLPDNNGAKGMSDMAG